MSIREIKDKTVWVPKGYYSKAKIKEDDIQMLPLEETLEVFKIVEVIKLRCEHLLKLHRDRNLVDEENAIRIPVIFIEEIIDLCKE